MSDYLQQPFAEDKIFQDIINGQRSLVVFVRQLGCPVSRNFLAQLRKQYKLITEKGVQVIVITPSDRIFLEKFVDAFGSFPFSIYGDPKQVLYQKMGHNTMAKWKLLAKAGKAYLKNGKSTYIPQDEKQQEVVKEALKTQDIYIQGGSWLFDVEGYIKWSHIDKSPEDHATIEKIVNELH